MPKLEASCSSHETQRNAPVVVGTFSNKNAEPPTRKPLLASTHPRHQAADMLLSILIYLNLNDFSQRRNQTLCRSPQVLRSLSPLRLPKPLKSKLCIEGILQSGHFSGTCFDQLRKGGGLHFHIFNVILRKLAASNMEGVMFHECFIDFAAFLQPIL